MKLERFSCKTIAWMFVDNTKSLELSVGGMKTFLPWLLCQSWLVFFLPFLLVLFSIPHWHPSPHPIYAGFPQNFVLGPFFTLCIFSLIHSVALKPLSDAYSQTSMFSSYLFTATYIHLHREYLLGSPLKQPVPKAEFISSTPLPPSLIVTSP